MRSNKNFKRLATIVSAAVLAFSSLSITSAVTASAAAQQPDNYAKLLQHSLYFYDANMCGSQVDEKSQMTWRGDCHTSDEVDGGFHDAGDHAMFGLPQGYTASTLGWAYYEFKNSFDELGQTEHYQTISDHFAEFFRNCTKLNGNTVSKICIQKGLGGTDHNYWGAPETQGNRGGCDWRSSGCGDIAAEYAAALALNYINFGNTEDLKYAKALYDYAKKNPSTSTGDCKSFYSSDTVNDDLAWAAGWLYLATKDNTYKTDCASKQTQYIGWVHDWNNVSLGAACVYAHITGEWGKVNNWINSQTTNNSYWFLLEWGSARYNANMQLCALAATKNSSADYSAWCKNQMNYLLGDNPANTCFVVGFADNSASKPHHRAASGTTSANDNGPSKYTLVGALVGGPSTADGKYQDLRSDYQCNEVAIDYNAGLVGAAAGLYDVFKTGTLDDSIVGVKGFTNPPSDPTDAPVATEPTQADTDAPEVTETTEATEATEPEMVEGGVYTITPNLAKADFDSNYPCWKWSAFGIPAGERATRVEATVSCASGVVGTWNGAFGSVIGTDGWFQTDDFNNYYESTTATAVWYVDSDTADMINYVNGDLKVGFWWTSANDLKMDSITVYTEKPAPVEIETTEAIEPETTEPTTEATESATDPTEPVTEATEPTEAETAAPTEPETTAPTTEVMTTEPSTKETVDEPRTLTDEPVYGDIDENGQVNIMDVILLNRYLMVGASISDQGKANADVDLSGECDATDALVILKHVVRIIEYLPIA